MKDARGRVLIEKNFMNRCVLVFPLPIISLPEMYVELFSRQSCCFFIHFHFSKLKSDSIYDACGRNHFDKNITKVDANNFQN